MRHSINTTLTQRGGNPVAIVSAGFPAIYIHDGTGIYGPKKQPIVPVNARVLRFRIGGRTVFAKSVKGIKPKPFFTKAIKRVMKPARLGEIWRRAAGIELFRK